MITVLFAILYVVVVFVVPIALTAWEKSIAGPGNAGEPKAG